MNLRILGPLLLGAIALSAREARSQVCGPLAPSGQPAIAMFAPLCVAPLPPPVVWAAGNPAFALDVTPLVPPFPPGAFVVLLLALPSPPVPIPTPPLDPMFGGPGLLVFPVAVSILVGPAIPGLPLVVPAPLPPTGGPLGTISAQMAVISMPFPALAGATAITI